MIPAVSPDKSSESKAQPGPSFLADETTFAEFVCAWEAGMLPRSAWTHAAHVAVVAAYAFDRPEEPVFHKMKQGILHYAACVGIVNDEDHGYHETLTRFWSALVSDFVRERKLSSRLEAARGAVAEFGPRRDCYLDYYTFDVAKDRRARREWVPPDRADFKIASSEAAPSKP